MPAKEKFGEKPAAGPRKKGGRPRKLQKDGSPGKPEGKRIVSPKTSREYRLTSRGEVHRVLANGRLQPLKPWYSGPYECVYLYGVAEAKNKQKRKKAYIHKLVADHFLKKAAGKPFVHHKNGRERDNRLENLEFTTLEENLKARKFNYRDEKGTVKRKVRGKKKEKPKPAAQPDPK